MDSDDRYFSPAATHQRLLALEARVAELEAALADQSEVPDRSGLLEASGLSDCLTPAERKRMARAKKARYMRDYMARKREEKRLNA